MLTWAGVVLALTMGGGFASDARTDQPLMARLSKAARRGDVDRVLAGAVGLAREELETLAREATCGGQPAMLRALLERGARPELFGAVGLRCMLRERGAPGMVTYTGRAPQPLAFDDAPLVEVIRLLLARGVDPRDGVLGAAVRTCHPALVGAVLEAKVDVEQAPAEYEFETPLMNAAHCPGESMQLLLDHGASGAAEDRSHMTALEHLILAMPDPAAFRSRFAALRAHGTRPKSDPVPLLLAAQFGNEAAVNELVSVGWNPNAQDKAGNAPLHRLAESCYAVRCLETARALVRAGASLEATNAKGETPYAVAVRAGSAPRVGDALAHWSWKPLGPLGATAVASGVLVEPGRAPDRYVPAHALDGQPATCWCVRGAHLPTPGDYAGGPDQEVSPNPPWIEVSFPHPVRVRALRVYPGCGEAAKIFQSNNRVANLDVEGVGEKRSLSLPDEMRYLDLGVSSDDAPVDAVRLVLQAVHRGAKYDDTCIAEIQAVVE